MHNDSTQNPHAPGELNSEYRARKVLSFQAGPLQFAIAEEYVATIAGWRVPTPLPQAPEAVLGVVSIQGRMLTVIDLARMSGAGASTADVSYNQIIALRGEENIALAASVVGESIVLSPNNSESETDGNERFVQSLFTHAGTETKLLNASELFAAAMHGRERRRRRF